MNSATTDHDHAPHLRDYINVMLRRRRLVLGILALTVLGGLCVTLLMLPIYQAAATLRVQAQGPGGQGGGPIIDPIGDAFGMRRAMELDTELQILKSRSLAEEAVRRLHYQFQLTPSYNPLVALYRKARTWLPASVEVSWLALPRQPAFALQDVEVGDIAAPASYSIAILEEGKFVVQTAQPQRDVGQGTIGQPFRSAQFAFRLESQELQAGDTIAFSLLPFWQATAQFQDCVTVLLRPKTEIVEVTARAVSPTLARDMAMALAQAYIAFVLQQKTQEASQILDFVELQLAGTQAQLEASAGSLGRFKEQKGFVTLSSEAQATLEKITKFDTSLREIQSTLKEAEDLRRRLQTSSTSPDSRTIYTVGSGVGSQALISLAERLATLQVNFNTVRAQYTPRHPAVLQAEQQVQSVKERIVEELSTLITNLHSRAASLQDIVREYETQLEKLPQAELELVKLTRQTTVNEELYSFLLKKREETRIVRASTVSNVRIIDPPLVPTVPISPRKGRNILLAVGLGLVLGMGVAFFVEYFDDSIKMIEDAEQGIGLPLVGAIPEMFANGHQRQGNVRSPLLVQGVERGVAVEGFKSLRTNIQFVDIGDAQRKKLVLTSPSMGDGKSTIAANLALYLGVAGHKSLLIDTDLRRPSLSRLFALPSRPGLMEVLGEDIAWREAVRTVGEQVDLMPCGELPISPPELLASRRLRELLGEWEAAYDYVIFDAPPVLAVTDPVIIGGLCQGVLLVVRANKTSARLVKRSQAVLEAAHVPIVGLVLNGLKLSHGYGYGYGYGYYYSENGNGHGKRSRKPRQAKSQNAL